MLAFPGTSAERPRHHMAVVVFRNQLLAKASHYPRHRRIDAAQEMVPRNARFEMNR